MKHPSTKVSERATNSCLFLSGQISCQYDGKKDYKEYKLDQILGLNRSARLNGDIREAIPGEK